MSDALLSCGFSRVEWTTRKGYGSDNGEVIWTNCDTRQVRQGSFEL